MGCGDWRAASRPGNALGPRGLAFASNGVLAVPGFLWDARAGVKLALPDGGVYPSGGYVNDSPNCVALSPDGRWLAVGTAHEFRLHDVTAGGTIAFTWDETDCVTRLAFSADGRRLATVGRVATIVWDTDPDAGMADDDASRTSAAASTMASTACIDPIGRPASRASTIACSLITGARLSVASPPRG